MKIAVLAESSADEAAIRILIDGILEVPAEIADLTPRARGWSSVLKEELYGRYFSLEHETHRAVQEARRLVPYLDGLEQQFPQGFGTLAREVRAWRYLCPDG